MLDPLVAVLPADTGGCGFYRMREPSRCLIAEGFPVFVDAELQMWFRDIPTRRVVRDRQSGVIMGVEETVHKQVEGVHKPMYDVVVFQRPTHRFKTEAIPYLQEQGVAVVVELDDDFENLDPRNLAWKSLHPKLGTDRDRTRANMREAVTRADLVTVSTPALQSVYTRFNPNVRVLPNYIPARYLAIGRRRLAGHIPQGNRIGWAGSIATHPGDLEATRGGVSWAMRGHPEWVFHVVGTGTGVARRLSLTPDQERELTTSAGWVPLEEYPDALAELDLGIVPLALNRFNEGKSYLKGLEMSSVGVPFVATPTQQYQLLHSLGAGRLASKSKDWRREVHLLMESEDYRLSLAAAAHATAERLTYESNSEQWWTAWTEALLIRRQAA